MLSDTLPPSRLINAWLARSKPVEIQIMNDGIRWGANAVVRNRSRATISSKIPPLYFRNATVCPWTNRRGGVVRAARDVVR